MSSFCYAPINGIDMFPCVKTLPFFVFGYKIDPSRFLFKSAKARGGGEGLICRFLRASLDARQRTLILEQ